MFSICSSGFVVSSYRSIYEGFSNPVQIRVSRILLVKGLWKPISSSFIVEDREWRGYPIGWCLDPLQNSVFNYGGYFGEVLQNPNKLGWWVTHSFAKVKVAPYDLRRFSTPAKFDLIFPSPTWFFPMMHLIFIWFHYCFFHFPLSFYLSYISITRKPSFLTHHLSASSQPLMAVPSYPMVHLTKGWHIRLHWSNCSIIWGLRFKTFEFFFIGSFRNFIYFNEIKPLVTLNQCVSLQYFLVHRISHQPCSTR